jgi:hypothetical protein
MLMWILYVGKARPEHANGPQLDSESAFTSPEKMPYAGLLCRVIFVDTDVPPKRLFLQEPHCVTSQKMAFFIVTAVKTSNPTFESENQASIHFKKLKHRKSLRQNIPISRHCFGFTSAIT